MNSAVIVAGGAGFRFGGDIPKQFIKIDGQEILSFSVNTFLDHPKIDEVIIVCHPDWIDTVFDNYPNCKVVKGGKRRQDSSLNGVLKTDEKAEIILIHDAARPFVSIEIISACLEALDSCEGSAPVMDVYNSLIQLDNDSASYVDRSKIREVQTPQCFKKELMLKVLSDSLEGTDEIGMVLRKFPKTIINFVAGEEKNYKITSKVDLQIASHIISNH